MLCVVLICKGGQSGDGRLSLSNCLFGVGPGYDGLLSGVLYGVWYGVCDFVVLSVVEVCVDYGGVNVFHVCLDFGVVYVDLKNDDVYVLWLIVVCERVGGVLLVMGCCVGCAWHCCYELCGCVNGTSPVWVCIVVVLSVCISDEPSVCCVCGYI